ncbi:Occludin/ELL family protein [Synechococcus sp. CBW1004]|uniref:Occludin/ELL family protein n=1 Tax=Synechococcus sp. CBW1004 TaxID=1353136 RepID=UPI0018CEC4EB|nr:Occludin/ELL family protein [Synechococcus sp. CBW1004]
MPTSLSTTDDGAGNSTRSRRSSRPLACAGLAMGSLGLICGATGDAAQAGPLSCTTSLEAPIMATREASGSLAIPASPVEVTRCVPVETVPQLIERRAYTWTPPYAPGVDLLRQATSILGIAMGGIDGNRVMGFGFPDQTLIWDGTAIQNTTNALLEEQSSPMPLRTPDLVSVFSTSLGSGGRLAQPPNPEEGGMPSVYLNPPLLLPTQNGNTQGF